MNALFGADRLSARAKLGDALRLLALAAIVLTANRGSAEVLYGPTYYQSAVASSTFYNDPHWGINNVFDSDIDSQWASWANTLNGNNPQGNQEVWFSFALDQLYNVNAIRFAPRQATGGYDGISGLKVWIGATPFGVDVTSATSTSTFLSTDPLGASPTLTQAVNIPNPYVPATYSLASPVAGQYFLVELTTTLFDIIQNIGAREFVVSVGPSAVPEIDPAGLGSVAGLVLGALGLVERRRRRS